MFKKFVAVFMAFTLLFVLVNQTADAKPRGSIKSPKKSYTQTPTTPKTDNNVSQTNPGTKTGTTTGTTGKTTANRGFFSGGSFMKGLMIGGIAGLLFGGLFSNMGFLGNLIGLLMNIMAIVALIALVRFGIRYFRDRRHSYNRRR
ncbi:hypothetical protein PCCS19_45690 [Paenibacillus sp. CCS19]|uniref:hypothetical protein n=1 Tax=Paenibacillus sp. CCS19 TaxID=3158387 RepID=UPI002560D1CA|nr:hypothetical protein [Paenibacillus cellulosilyticus]GMK41512.1 hypothetical protein PCCS19_45690 [Paenibacillus cellulosilyticus]